MSTLDNFDMRIEFHPDQVPAAVWWAVWDGVEGRVLDQEQRHPDSQHSVHRYLRSLERSVVGFHWRWEPAPCPSIGSVSDAQKAVIAGGEAARASAASLAQASGDVINQALREMAARLTERAPEILAANAGDMADGAAAGLGQGLLDRLRLDPGRMQEMARQIGLLADAPFPAETTPLGNLPGGPSGGGLRLAERRVPVGVIGANFEARPNVTIDIASQLLKSRNAGVLRTGGAALLSAAALADQVIAPRHRPPGWIRGWCSWSGPRTGKPRSSWSASRASSRWSSCGAAGRPRAAWPPRRPGPGCARSRTPTGAACSTWIVPPTRRWPPRSSPAAWTGWACATGSISC